MEDHRRADQKKSRSEEEQVRRRADQKGGFAVRLGGTTLHTNARATAVACRRRLARLSTKKETTSFVILGVAQTAQDPKKAFHCCADL